MTLSIRTDDSENGDWKVNKQTGLWKKKVSGIYTSNKGVFDNGIGYLAGNPVLRPSNDINEDAGGHVYVALYDKNGAKVFEKLREPGEGKIEAQILIRVNAGFEGLVSESNSMSSHSALWEGNETSFGAGGAFVPRIVVRADGYCGGRGNVGLRHIRDGVVSSVQASEIGVSGKIELEWKFTITP